MQGKAKMSASPQKGPISRLLRAFKMARRRIESAAKRRPAVAASASRPEGDLSPVSPELLSNLRSRWELTKLIRPRGVGIELGVATGAFSELLLSRSDLAFLYSVDSYADQKHNVDEYRAAIQTLMPFRNRNTIIRMPFDQAAALFPNEYFDLVYIDGFAEFGEEGGRTIYDWFPKVRIGGILAGHDYSPRWPRVIEEVDRFVDEKKLDLFTVGGTEESIDRANRFASWFTFRR